MNDSNIISPPKRDSVPLGTVATYDHQLAGSADGAAIFRTPKTSRILHEIEVSMSTVASIRSLAGITEGGARELVEARLLSSDI
jgi:hypothetical protein